MLPSRSRKEEYPVQNNSALRLVNSAAVEAAHASSAQDAARKRAARVPSPAAQLAQQRLAMLSQMYSRTLTDDQRRAYATLAQSYPVGKTGSTQARSCFISLNSSRLQVGMNVLLDPGPFRDVNAPIPAYTLTASYVNGNFLLAVTPDKAFSGSIVSVSATKPLSGGVMLIPQTAYQFLLSTGTLPLSGLDLSDAYVNALGRPAVVGTRVGVCLTPVSAVGFPGPSLYRDLLVTDAS